MNIFDLVFNELIESFINDNFIYTIKPYKEKINKRSVKKKRYIKKEKYNKLLKEFNIME